MRPVTRPLLSGMVAAALVMVAAAPSADAVLLAAADVPG
jgi:hypothetical protein